MIMPCKNHARKIVPCVLCQHWFLNWKKDFVDLFKKVQKCHGGKIGINKKYEGQKGNKNVWGEIGIKKYEGKMGIKNMRGKMGMKNIRVKW